MTTHTEKMHPIIEDLNWRYAVKKYDPERKIPEEKLKILKEAVRLSPSSMGLQAYQVLDIQNPEVREKLKKASHDQQQVTDASHFFLFCHMVEIPDSYIDSQIDNISKIRKLNPESLKTHRKALLDSVKNKEIEKRNTWTSKQAYIALGYLLHTAAQLKIDATPMEGFEADEYNRILGLEKHGLSAAVACVLGYRSQEDKHQHQEKVRKSLDSLFITV